MTRPSPELPHPYTLRPANPAELRTAIAIDDAAAALFASVGIVFELDETHPFVMHEYRRWQAALVRGDLELACFDHVPVGFFALACLDGAAYLEQLSVHPDHGRRGLGRALLETACHRFEARGAREIWLTTYAHVPWNAPFYARAGFHCVAGSACNAALREVLAEQQAALPAPEQRVAMVRSLA